MTNTMERETITVERATAKRFLEVYNQRLDMEFKITKLGDSPDVRCVDGLTSDVLNLEVCVLEDKPGYARWRLGRDPKSSASFGVRSFSDVLTELRKLLRGKFRKRYGSRTALVVRQLSASWVRDDWNRYLPQLSWPELGYRPEAFDCGVWLLTLKEECGLRKDDIMRIDPGVNTAGL